jgi:hypothetical protein
VPSLSEFSWSDDVAQADWVGERLTPRRGTATALVQSGFEAYARILHPSEEPRWGEGRLVRWHEVAAWSGLPLDPYVQFHSVALPPHPLHAPPPWSGQGPRHGSLFPPDAAVVIDHLRHHTATPDRCWFCLWDGYGWPGDMVPEAVENGPRVRLPDRNYYLYRGAVDGALVGYPGEPPAHTANLWWPDDHAWCVASEIDLSWTYVGGSAGLVGALVSEPAIEALEVAPDLPCFRAEAWVERWVTDALEPLSSAGHALISTPVGTVEAWLDLPPSSRRGSLRTSSRSVLGHHGGATHYIDTSTRSGAAIVESLSFYLRSDIIALVVSDSKRCRPVSALTCNASANRFPSIAALAGAPPVRSASARAALRVNGGSSASMSCAEREAHHG